MVFCFSALLATGYSKPLTGRDPWVRAERFSWAEREGLFPACLPVFLSLGSWLLRNETNLKRQAPCDFRAVPLCDLETFFFR